jgi:hypothetical protein
LVKSGEKTILHLDIRLTTVFPVVGFLNGVIYIISLKIIFIHFFFFFFFLEIQINLEVVKSHGRWIIFSFTFLKNLYIEIYSNSHILIYKISREINFKKSSNVMEDEYHFLLHSQKYNSNSHISIDKVSREITQFSFYPTNNTKG